MLENTLEREQEFLELLRRYNTKNVIVNPLHQLLLGINPCILGKQIIWSPSQR
jgi:hypothetical protein